MTPPDPASFNQPALDLLGPAQIDNVARALITLTREVAVLTDRVMVLEAVLDDAGIAVSEAVEQHQPDAALQARIDARIGEMLGHVIASLRGADGAA